MIDVCSKGLAQSIKAAERRERGSALILALLVALVLSFLGMGLLLQTSLGQQSAAVDRSVVKALYAADAGIWMQVQMVQGGQVVGPSAPFVLTEDPSQEGFFRGTYEVAISDFCEIEPPSRILGWANQYRKRSVHMHSEAERQIGISDQKGGLQIQETRRDQT